MGCVASVGVRRVVSVRRSGVDALPFRVHARMDVAKLKVKWF